MLFMQEIQNCVGRDVGLLIWSAKVHSLSMILRSTLLLLTGQTG